MSLRVSYLAGTRDHYLSAIFTSRGNATRSVLQRRQASVKPSRLGLPKKNSEFFGGEINMIRFGPGRITHNNHAVMRRYLNAFAILAKACLAPI